MTQFVDALGFDASDTLVRSVAYALPLAVLLTLLVLLGMKAKKKAKSKAKSTIDTHIEDSAGLAVAVDAIDVSTTQYAPQHLGDAPAAAPVPTAHFAMLQQPSGANVAPPLVHAPVVEAAAPHAAIANLKAQLLDAATLQPKSAIAPLYLELARHCRQTGDEAACLAALRAAALHATQHGPRAAHAEARLELAEAAYKTGDTIGACEQWQMARTAYHEDGQKAAYASIDKRMRDNGCPTDWVLTDF